MKDDVGVTNMTSTVLGTSAAVLLIGVRSVAMGFFKVSAGRASSIC